MWFLCNTHEDAREAALKLDDAIPNVTTLPGSCRWWNGQHHAKVLEHVEYLTLPSGDHVVIGRVQMLYPAAVGYSAGKTELMLG